MVKGAQWELLAVLRAGNNLLLQMPCCSQLTNAWASRKDGGVDDTDDSRGGGVMLDEGYSVS